MGDCLVLPVGITRETVENIVKNGLNIKYVVSVTVPGFEEEKKGIVEGIRMLSELSGAMFYHLVVRPNDPVSVYNVYNVLKNLNYDRLILVVMTGSRYLILPLLSVILKLWKEHGKNVEFLAIHGVEGEEGELVPLVGFISPAMKITAIQRRLLDIIYGSDDPVSGKLLIEKYGFTRSVYYVLADLERKGLVRVRRGRIERTFPGEIFYLLTRGEK